MRCLSRTVARTVLACTSAILFQATPAFAQFTWTNAAGGNWSVGANWGGTAPAPGGSATTTLTFGAAGIIGSSYTANNDLAGVFAVNGLSFNGSAAASVTLTANAGNSLNFTGAGPGISHTATGTGIVLLLTFLPGGLGDLVFQIRDWGLRWFAGRRGIRVPSLLAVAELSDV